MKHTRTKVCGDHSIVVFTIGAKVRKWWMLHRVLWVAWSFQKMVRELRARPELGCLDVRNGGGMTVMIWRSKEALMDYARANDEDHLPVWTHFNRVVRQSGAVGVWHEIYEVAAGAHTSLHINTPAHGLASAMAKLESSQPPATVAQVRDETIMRWA